MSGLQYQTPLVVDDFSGGLTENIVPGAPNKYQVCDNLILTNDRKLRSRPGSVVIDETNYILPSGAQRVGALISFANDTTLIAQSGQYLYEYTSTAWSPLIGPTGNSAFGVGGADTVASYSEWQKHLFLANDAGSPPIKVYRDSSDTLQVRTAGLPDLAESLNQNTASLLSHCILLANDLRTQILSHVNDTTIHAARHASVYAALSAVSVASDEATLYTLVGALNTAFSDHVEDAQLLLFRAYHFDLGGAPNLLNISLTNDDTPTTLTGAATQLDDLFQKYYWHVWATYTHDGINSATNIRKWLPTVAKAGTVSSRPIITPNYDTAISLANTLKDSFNGHIADVTHYHRTADTYDRVSCDDATDYDSLIVLIVHLRIQYYNHWNDANQTFTSGTIDTAIANPAVTDVKVGGVLTTIPTGSTIISGAFTGYITASSPGAGTFTASAGANSTNNDIAFQYTYSDYHNGRDSTAASAYTTSYAATGSDVGGWMDLLVEMANCFNSHEANATAHISPNSSYLVLAYEPQFANYIYAFHYFYEYTVGDVTYQDLGPVLYSDTVETGVAYPPGVAYGITGLITSATDYTEISNLPVLSNGYYTNYDTAQIKIKIYRTTDDGTTYYYLGEVTNGTTTFSDGVNDTVAASGGTALQDGETLYTTGGVVDNDPPPQAKFLHILNGVGYYGAITEDGTYLGNRLRQSIQGDPDSCPADFYDDLDDELTGISSAKGLLVALCKQSVYRIEGQFNELGQGFLSHQVIAERIGCLGSASIVRTEHGVFFAGTDGFYYTDGYQIQKLSLEFDRLYQAHTQSATQRQRISGAYDPLSKQIWWGMQSTPTGSGCDVAFICHLNYANFPFTTASNGTSWRPSCFSFYQNQLLRGDERGYVFKHSLAYKTDPEVADGVVLSDWTQIPIIFDYVSCALDLGTSAVEKWVPRITVSGKNVGNLTLQINSINDQKTPEPLSLIRYRANMLWGDPTVVWGDASVVWGADGTMDEWRRFPSGSMKLTYKQIEFTNDAEILIAKSDVRGTCRVFAFAFGASPTILDGGTAYAWPTDPVNYNIYFESDGYVKAFPILAGSTTTNLRVGAASDGTHPPTGALQKWEIRGVPKNEAFHLLNYQLQYAFLGDIGRKPYMGLTQEGGAGNA